MTTYKQMPNKLINREEFNGNSVTATIENGIYKVYSYNTLIFSHDINNSENYFNNKYYSNTTSRIQNMLISIFNLRNYDVEPKKAIMRERE
ncbi:MAG TPA: hypothetical protein PL042_06830 [Caldisericia bacterium]|nr:hypothetical protein [Caldisericia bacterium]